jgi:rhodanese-related sulfurtransferase
MNNIKIWSISVSEFKQKMKQDYVLIDIRTLTEIQEAKIEWIDLILDCYSPNFMNELDKLDRNKKYLIYCRSGSRTWMSLKIMSQLWFKEVYDLEWWLISWVNTWEELVK